MTTYTDIVTPDDWVCENCGTPAKHHVCGIKRRRRKFVAMLRIKNEEARIAEVLIALHSLCDDIFVFDDHSTDRTAAISQSLPKVRYFLSPFEGLNESRDKNWLYDRIMAYCEPEWIVCVDGDEVLEKRGSDIIQRTVAENPDVQSYRLKIAFIWDREDQVRVDRIYNDFWRPSMFRPFIPRPHVPDDLKILQEFRFMATPFGRHVGTDQPNLHCSSVPQRRIHGSKVMPVRLKHYGYMDRDDRVRKLDYYNSIDWLNASEDCYRHMTQGDDVLMEELPRVEQLNRRGLITDSDMESLRQPANACLVHAGPRVLAPWDEDADWSPSFWAVSQ